MAIILAGLVWSVKHPASIQPFERAHVLNKHTFFLAQFMLFFLINAILFQPHTETPAHFRNVAIESWGLSLVFLPLVSSYLMRTRDLKSSIIRWLPIGLMLAFAVSSVIYLTDLQGYRVKAFTPSPLTPPLWFLVFTCLSFCWFDEMSRLQKGIRLVLIAMAGITALYSSARLILAAWVIVGPLIGVYIILLHPKETRRTAVMIAIPIMILAATIVIGIELISGSIMIARFKFFILGFTHPELILQRMPRLELWSASLALAKEHPLTGIGLINEYIAIREQLDANFWLRSHQTYLSFLLTGGVFGLISGIVVQLPILSFITRSNRRALFPAFIGLGIVINLNFLTDSIFQSTANVQAYALMVLTIVAANRLNTTRETH